MAKAPQSGGSQYENYDSTSSSYDLGRQVTGLEIVLGALANSGTQQKQLNTFRVLDAGCGTGNCSIALSPFVGHVHGLEHSKGMLAKAQEKTQHLKNVELQEGDITCMPYLDEYLDGIIINQVLHHLVKPGPDYSQVEKFLQESYRVLVPKGALIIQISSDEQYSTYWYYQHIVPEASDRLLERNPSTGYLTSALAKAGFQIGGVYSIVSEQLMNPALYLLKEGPFDKNWRNMDSVWSLATPAELESGLKRWKEKIDSGEADKMIAECEEKRQSIGSTIAMVAYK